MSYDLNPTPSNRQAARAPSLTDLEHGGIRFIRVTWIDLANLVRCRILPLAHFRALCESARPGITTPRATPAAVFNHLTPPFTSVEEVLYVPDLSTVSRLPYAPTQASVLGWFQEKDGSMQDRAGQFCPRGLLNRVVEYASKEAGVEFLVGFESEFILLHQTTDGSIKAVNNHPWSGDHAFLAGTVESKAVEEMVETLMSVGIVVEQFHSEAAPGQYETVTGPLPPLQAVDALIRTRETIRNVASKHGLRATFAPRVFDYSCGSACHAHISVHPTGNVQPTPAPPPPPARPQPVLSSHEASFLAGLLAHFRALTALTLPTSQSYARVEDGVWSGGSYVPYGSDNREAPVRVCGPPRGRHLELRVLDPTANPYVALAGVLGVGARAIKEGKRLKMGECAVMPAAQMSEEKRETLGVTERLPRSLEEARKALEGDEVVMDVLGEVGNVWRGVSEASQT